MKFAKAISWLKKSIAGPVATLQPGYGGTDSYSGKPVNVQTALQLAAFWACVRLISETIATLPLQLYQRDTKGGRTLARDHWLYTILHDQPNANMTAVEFWEALVAQLCLWGNAYCFKTYAGGRIVSLDPLKPGLMTVKTDLTGALKYHYTTDKGIKVFGEDEIWHLKGFGVDGLIGLSPVSYARNSLGASMSSDEASGKVFASGMRPGGALKMGQLLNPKQRTEIRDSLAPELAGTANTGKMMILEGGMEYQALAMNPDDAQMLETRGFHVEEICRWFRVPPFMVGHSEKSTSWGTGLEQQMLGFLTFALRPYLSRIEQGIKKSLLSPVDRLKFHAEFSLEGLMRADSAGRAALYSTMVQNGIYTRDEVRRLENLPEKGGNAAELTIQVNMAAIDSLPDSLEAIAAAKKEGMIAQFAPELSG